MYDGAPKSTSWRGQLERALSIIVFIGAAILAGFAGWNLYSILAEDLANDEVIAEMQSFTSYQSAHATGTSMTDGPAMATMPGVEDAAGGSGGDGLYEQDGTSEAYGFSVDMTTLEDINPDIIGWIRIPGTNISHAVVQGQDNDWYLYHGPDGKENRAGSIFLDVQNDGCFKDPNTVLYGHRMNNGTMFAELHRYEDPVFLAESPYVYLTDRSGQETAYRIFEVSEAGYELTEPAYLLSFGSEDIFRSWGASPVGQAYSFQDADLHEGDRVLTLSTCVRGDGARRFIVRAKAA